LRVHCQLLTTPLFDSWSFDKLLTTLEDIGPERELERHKEDWRNMIAHDLRSPMTNVLGTLQLLEESPARAAMSADEGKLLAASIRSSRRLLALLNLYLDIAKLDAGLMRVRAEPVALPELAAACADEQQMAAAEKRITVALAVPPGLRARADADLLFRVLQNLLANALKYAPPGGRVEVRGRRDGAAVELSVRDDGPGIAPEDQDRLFDRFFQAEARRGGKIQGTGLGLTFCREALKVMKGTIGVSSEVGQGSAFLVRLPAA
jgi:signal transduction histidine kinase